MRWATLLALALVASCGPAGAPTTESGPPARLAAGEPAETLHLVGELSGAFPGLGPKVQIEAWLRGDGRARATIRGESEGQRTHEVLVWTGGSCILFDARTGRFVDLGASDGTLEALDNRFRLEDAVFLLSGRDPAWPGVEDAGLVGAATRFRGVRSAGTLRREGDEAGIRWVGKDGTIHDIAVSYDGFLETLWGPWPGRVTVSGTELTAAARLQWKLVDPVVVLGDSIFDPLWEPDPL
jgi:hypothetical protein